MPSTIMGSQRWLSRSSTLPQLHGASRYSGENRPPTFMPNQAKAMYMTARASRKLGMARPRKPRKVAR
ncbi:hypothetical protein D3C87_2151930 [compost metagenome]